VAIPLPFLNLRKNTEDFGYDSKYSGLYRIPGEHMVATDIKAYLRDMTQEQWNEWMAGRLSIAAIVRDYRAMIDLLGYRARILDGIRGHDGDSILRIIEVGRPDLRIRDPDGARRRIDQELAEIRRMLA